MFLACAFVFSVNFDAFFEIPQQVVLAARSEYFRALLYGGMKESTQVNIFN